MQQDRVTVPVPRKSLRLAILLFVCAFIGTGGLGAQQFKPTEYQVEAAYLYNFGRFIQWPPAAANQDEAFPICVIGQDPFGPILDTTFAGKTLNGKPVAAVRIEKPQDATHCRILFIDATQEKHLEEILSATSQVSVLTVSNIADFSTRGGMIQFVLADNRVRFQVNRSRAEHVGLTLSSDLLKVAISVTGTTNPGPGE